MLSLMLDIILKSFCLVFSSISYDQGMGSVEEYDRIFLMVLNTIIYYILW